MLCPATFASGVPMSRKKSIRVDVTTVNLIPPRTSAEGEEWIHRWDAGLDRLIQRIKTEVRRGGADLPPHTARILVMITLGRRNVACRRRRYRNDLRFHVQIKFAMTRDDLPDAIASRVFKEMAPLLVVHTSCSNE